MTPLAAIQASLINGASCWAGNKQIGKLSAGFYADVIAVPGNPLDVTVLQHADFVMKNGVIYKR